jgi:hypothetical protein
MKIAHAIEIKMAFVSLSGLLLSGADGIGGSRVKPAELFVRSVSSQQLLMLLLLAMINIVELELRRRFLSKCGWMVALSEVDYQASSGPHGFVVLPSYVLT